MMQHVDVLGKTIELSKSEMIHTVDSFKYAVPEVEKMVRSAGYDEFQYRRTKKRVHNFLFILALNPCLVCSKKAISIGLKIHSGFLKVFPLLLH